MTLYRRRQNSKPHLLEPEIPHSMEFEQSTLWKVSSAMWRWVTWKNCSIVSDEVIATIFRVGEYIKLGTSNNANVSQTLCSSTLDMEGKADNIHWNYMTPHPRNSIPTCSSPCLQNIL